MRGRGPDIDLADMPLMLAGWGHVSNVPATPPELIPFRYYVFELMRLDPDTEDDGTMRGFHYAAHSEAAPPPGPSAPTFPDGSWSIRDLFRRTDLKVGDVVRITATVVIQIYKCPPCPPRRRCSRCRAPVVTFRDDPPGEHDVVIPYSLAALKPPITSGNRYVFEFEIDPRVWGGLRYRPPLSQPSGDAMDPEW